MKISVKDREGNIYSMPTNELDNSILAVHYCTSYYQFEVQSAIGDNGKRIFKDIIVLTDNPSLVDLIAVDDDEIGEIVKCSL